MLYIIAKVIPFVSSYYSRGSICESICEPSRDGSKIGGKESSHSNFYNVLIVVMQMLAIIKGPYLTWDRTG